MYRAPAKRDGEGAPTDQGKVTEKLESRRQKACGAHEDRRETEAGARRDLLFRGPGQCEFLVHLERFFAQPTVNGTLELPYGVQEALTRRCAFAQADPHRPPARRTHEQNVVAFAGYVSQLQQSASWNDGLV
ncbi:MAG: hypothetical protein DMG48_19750 [Acidobacteria bacterium]|nr:MAG: hypothetical protein DMG48_19750 [Acidobacteriota bacterium]